MYSSPIEAAWSIYALYVAVFTPASGRSTAQPFHQSQAALPGLIQLVSASADGLPSVAIRFDAVSPPGVSAIITTRQGVTSGFSANDACTAGLRYPVFGSTSARGDRVSCKPSPPSPRPL